MLNNKTAKQLSIWKNAITLKHIKLSLYISKHIQIFLARLNEAFVFVHLQRCTSDTYDIHIKIRSQGSCPNIHPTRHTAADTVSLSLERLFPPDPLRKRQHPPAVLFALVPEGVTSTTGLHALKNRGIITIPWLNIQTLHNR